MSYYSLTEAEFNHIKSIIEECQEHVLEMNSWEMQFMASMKTNLNKYGRDLKLTEKQQTILQVLYDNYCDAKEEKVRDTKDAFDELENRDKWRKF